MKMIERTPLNPDNSGSRRRDPTGQNSSRGQSKDPLKTYAPPHVTASNAFSSDEEDAAFSNQSRRNNNNDPEAAQRRPQQQSRPTISPRGSAVDSPKGSTGTPGVDRPPEKVVFPRKRDSSSVANANSFAQGSISEYRRRRDDDDSTLDDSVTIDSYLKDKAAKQQQQQMMRDNRRHGRNRGAKSSGGIMGSLTGDEETEDGNGTQVSVYHLAHEDVRKPSPEHRKKLNEWYKRNSRSAEDVEYARGGGHHAMSPKSDRRRGRGGGIISSIFGSSHDTTDDSHTMHGDDQAGGVFRVESAEYSPEAAASSSFFLEPGSTDEDYLKTKQETAYMSIGLTAIQLLVLCLQLAMCGIANLDINPFVGPYPDAFSEWGGKNAYLMIEKDQWFRLVSPSLLHVGILHLLANAFCQLEPIALFEREWGSLRWLILYLLSAVGCMSLSSLVDPDTVAVGSSGSLMGLFSAKLAQVMSHTIFEVNKSNQDDMIRLDQLSSVICGLTLVSLLSFFTYIDWSGHMGGLVVGFFGGMLFFCNPIRSCCWKILWALMGLLGLVGSLGYVFYSLLYLAEPADEELANACEYFRYFFPEDYECGCLWK